MSLKGLGKQDRSGKAIQDFIAGAAERVSALTPSNAKFERCNFSLTAEISKEIDRLSLIPRDFRVSRSDVVKAAIAAFAALPESEQIAQLAQLK